MEIILRLPHQADESILQARLGFLPDMFTLSKGSDGLFKSGGIMTTDMQRISEDVSWLVEKFDYRNKDADWKSSRDAIQRGMQKLKGGYPADPAYKMSK